MVANPVKFATREAVMQALFELVSTAAPFVTKERKIRIWTEVGQEERPYLGMGERAEESKRQATNPPAIRTWGVEFYIYTWARGVDVPASLLNPLLDAIEHALLPNPLTGQQTLGGLVTDAWINGSTFKDPGDIDGDGMAIVPVSILVP